MVGGPLFIFMRKSRKEKQIRNFLFGLLTRFGVCKGIGRLWSRDIGQSLRFKVICRVLP